ncbi:MAG: ABC transporter permease subunit [Propionibacteriaceae bacterium]|jgi:hypothetical protein|nr:ABC transporter permease subunit [Propionibacteriaceae bacterium]
MIAGFRSEFRKFFSTRMWWVMLLIAVAYVGGTAAIMAFLFDFTIDSSPELDTISLEGFIDLSQTIYSLGATFGYVFPVLVGALSVTGEYRHQTVTPTFLADPNRVRVLVTKLLAAIPLGLLYGVVTIGGTVALGGGVLALLDRPTGLTETSTWLYLGRSVLALTVWALVGIGLGALLKNQVAAIIVAIVFTQFLEPMLRVIPAMTGRPLEFLNYLPGAVSDSIVGKSMFMGMNVSLTEDAGQVDQLAGYSLLSPGLAVAVLAGYALVFAIAGYFTTWRKDVS